MWWECVNIFFTNFTLYLLYICNHPAMQVSNVFRIWNLLFTYSSYWPNGPSVASHIVIISLIYFKVPVLKKRPSTMWRLLGQLGLIPQPGTNSPSTIMDATMTVNYYPTGPKVCVARCCLNGHHMLHFYILYSWPLAFTSIFPNSF